MNKVGIGVIGVGVWGENQVRGIVANPRAELLAVADINAERAKYIAQQYGVKKWYTDYNEMLEDPDITAVGVATPDPMHKDPCVAAAKAGKHILVEKPLATTVEDGQAIVDAAKKSGIKLMVDFILRWTVPYATVKESIDKGELGDLLYIYARLSNTKLSPTEFLTWAAKSKVIWFLTVHMIDMARWYFKDDVKKVYSVTRTGVLSKLGVNTPDFYTAIAEFRNGGVATFESCWVIPNTLPGVGWGRWRGLGIDQKVDVIGSKGACYIDTYPSGTVQRYLDEEYTWPDILGVFNLHGKWTGLVVNSVAHFIDCIADDKEPMVSGEDGLAATRVLVAIERSAETGQAVNL